MKMNLFPRLLFLAALLAFSTGPNAAAENPRVNPLEAQMVLIPAGHFIFGTNQTDESAEALSMGIPKPWYADESPETKIFLKGFIRVSGVGNSK